MSPITLALYLALSLLSVASSPHLSTTRTKIVVTLLLVHFGNIDFGIVSKNGIAAIGPAGVDAATAERVVSLCRNGVCDRLKFDIAVDVKITSSATNENQTISKSNPSECGRIRTAIAPFPWHATIYSTMGDEFVYICGGTLITRTTVVTSAACVTRSGSVTPLDPQTLIGYLGRTHLRRWSGHEQFFTVDTITIYPGFDFQRFFSNFAALRLSRSIEFTDYIQPVCLAYPKEVLTIVDKRYQVVPYWGYKNGNLIAENISTIRMPEVSNGECITSNPLFEKYLIPSETFCAGQRDGRSLCNAWDGGAGMVFERSGQWFLRGIFSYSSIGTDLQCDFDQYVVFTDLRKFNLNAVYIDL